MLERLKRPDKYINRGVWLFLKNGQLVKRKIRQIDVSWNNNKWHIKSVVLENLEESFNPIFLYMRKTEALDTVLHGMEVRKKLLESTIKDLEESLIYKKKELQDIKDKILRFKDKKAEANKNKQTGTYYGA